MTITPGTPDDWTDTVEPERTEPDTNGPMLRDDCCSQTLRDACTDEWVQIAPVAAHPATLTPEQVEVQWPNGDRLLCYVDEGGYQLIARHVGDGSPFPWGDGRIVRVLTEDKPTDADTEDAVYLSGPMTGLPDFNRPAFHAAAAELRAQGHVVINPAEVDLGPDATWVDYMRIHLAEIARRVTQVFVLPGWGSSRGAQLEVHVARSLGLPVAPVPEPVDPDAAAIEAIVTAYRRSPECSTHDVFGEAMLDHLRAQGFDVTARAEQ